MSRLHQETDVALLQQAVQLLERENNKLSQQVIELTKQVVTLEGSEQQLVLERIAELERQLAARNKALFGDSSEKRPTKANVTSDKDKQTGHGPTPQPELPIEEREYDLDEPDHVCTSCGGQLDEWKGQYEESDEVTVVERRFVLVRHRRKKYRCSCGGCIETAPGPTRLPGGGRYSIDFAIEVATSKYLDHLPLERQVRIMKREGLTTSSQTLWDQLNRLAHLLGPSHDALREYVLSHDVVGADETTWRLMGSKKKGKHKRWQVWAVCAPDAVCYQLHDNRSAKAAAKLLDGFEGAVVCDGYGAYKSLAKQGDAIELAHCWSHMRRELLEAESVAPEATEGLELIGNLFGIDSRCPTGPPGEVERAKLRDTESRAVIKDLHTWALRMTALPDSPLGKAIAYMARHWTGLTRFLTDPRIPLHNNATERALRGVVIGRKNHYGSRSKRGTEVAALFYSLLESAKLAGVEPKTYLREAVAAALRDESIPLPHQLNR
jgi:transposase